MCVRMLMCVHLHGSVCLQLCVGGVPAPAMALLESSVLIPTLEDFLLLEDVEDIVGLNWRAPGLTALAGVTASRVMSVRGVAPPAGAPPVPETENEGVTAQLAHVACLR